MIISRLARPLIAAIFIVGGIDTLRNPEPKVKQVEPFLTRTVGGVAESLPEQVPTDPATLVRIDAAVKVGAGVLLALGKFPRLAAFALAVGLVPTSLAAHAFWEHEDPQARAAQKFQFLKNLGLLGGLLLVVTEPRKKSAAQR
ncbi:MAG TPA: DoxX family protein [Pseudonocardiaceae bacterium]|jgi:putative oxidoreductase|nr:DoxX family protein [Pseudonocardiaceae bacterium]